MVDTFPPLHYSHLAIFRSCLAITPINKSPWGMILPHRNHCVKILVLSPINWWLSSLDLSFLIWKIKGLNSGQFSHFSVDWNYLKGLLKHRLLGSNPRVSDSDGLAQFIFLSVQVTQMKLLSGSEDLWF